MRNLPFVLVMLALLAADSSALGQDGALDTSFDVLRKRAAESHSDAVIVFKNDEQIRSSWRYNQKTDEFRDFLPLVRSMGN